MRSTPLLQLLHGSLGPGKVARNSVLSMGQAEMLDIKSKIKQMT